MIQTGQELVENHLQAEDPDRKLINEYWQDCAKLKENDPHKLGRNLLEDCRFCHIRTSEDPSKILLEVGTVGRNSAHEEWLAVREMMVAKLNGTIKRCIAPTSAMELSFDRSSKFR